MSLYSDMRLQNCVLSKRDIITCRSLIDKEIHFVYSKHGSCLTHTLNFML